MLGIPGADVTSRSDRPKTCLTIAGSDPTGGAGIQVDLRTFSALGLYGVCAVTSVTAQNTSTVSSIIPVARGGLRAQIDAVIKEFPIDAVKIGMLSTQGNVVVVVETMKAHSLTKVVLDTVLFSSSGKRLLEKTAVSSLTKLLFPYVTVVTSNLKEAGILTGIAVRDKTSMKKAAMRLYGLGPQAVVVKGGHLPGAPDDLFYDGENCTFVRGTRTKEDFHGLGCAFSSAIAGFLALGYDIRQSVVKAKGFLEQSLKNSFAPPGGRRVITLARSRNG